MHNAQLSGCNSWSVLICLLFSEEFDLNKNMCRTTMHTLQHSHSRNIQTGNAYTLLFISRGSCYADIRGESVFCGTEDMILMNPHNSTALHNGNGKIPLEYLSISVTSEFLDELSDLDIDFEDAINFVPGNMSIAHIKSESAMLIKNLALQIIALGAGPIEFGHELFIKNMYSMLILLTIRSCIESDTVVKQHRSKKLLLDDIFGYISNHLTEEITLETLEREFFVSRYHICREFKRLTGLSPHAYIVKSRLNLCCRYIEQGLPINEVYSLGGFASYNHFFRAFKNEYRMTPKEYYKNVRG